MSARQPLADLAFIADFAAFCRTKGDGGYCFTDAGTCALAQFRPTMGIADANPLPCGIEQAEDGLWDPEIGSPLSRALVTSPQTFSALADRLEALIVDAPVVERAS